MLRTHILPCHTAAHRAEAHRLEEALELHRDRLRTMAQLHGAVQRYNTTLKPRVPKEPVVMVPVKQGPTHTATLYQYRRAVLIVVEKPDAV